MRDYVKGRGPIGDFLYDTFENCQKDQYAYSRVIWDIATIAYLINPDWVPTQIVHSPILTDQVTWSFSASRNFIRYAHAIHRDPIFKDLFKKLESNKL